MVAEVLKTTNGFFTNKLEEEYLSNVFLLLNVEDEIFRERLNSRKPFAVLLKNWMLSNYRQNITDRETAKTIAESNILTHMKIPYYISRL